ncbi:MAG: molybdopterin-dependent oxidoreductase, partial [Collinsella sp.]|nr:molybdopterin-dependent oxidoreductase [Collinsella sp.]
MGILQQLDLLVTIDIRWSETARASDFVLPDVTYLEADRGVGTVTGANDARVFFRNAVLPILHDDTRPGREIFAGLAAACGVDEYFDFSPDDLAAAQVAPFGIDLDELKERGWADTGVALPSRTGEPAIPLDGGKIAL